MKALKVPTIFEAVDKISRTMKKMEDSVRSFATTAETNVARGERMFRKLTPALGETANQMFLFAKAAAIAAAVIGTINFSIQAVKDYENAIQSFRTIVSDLSDKDFAKYKNSINAVAKDTKKSSIEVAQSYEKIAGLNATFAKTSESIAAVSKASIILSKASGDELGSSAESLVGIMNQFGFAATEADRTINVLAAGQAVGAASIALSSEAFKNFGSVAKGANISLEESVGLIQTLGKFSVFGAEAGTKLRGSILKLQQATLGYQSGQFNINDALAEAKEKIDKLATAKQKDAAILKMFGAENIATGKILLANIDTFKNYTAGVTGTNAAYEQANIRSKTFTGALDELKNSWINIITSSDSATSALSTATKIIQFLTNNLEIIVSVGTKILLFFAAWKALLIITKGALAAYNIGLGIMGALSGVASIAIGKNAIALGAYNVVLKLVTAAQWLWNAAMTANPIGLIILGIAALIALVVTVINKWNEWGAALSLFMGPLGTIISMIQSFRRNWDLLSESFSKGGILEGLKAIVMILADGIIMPMEQLLKLAANLTGAKWAQDALKGISMIREKLGVNLTTDETGNPLQKVKDQNKNLRSFEKNIDPLTKTQVLIPQSLLNGMSGGGAFMPTPMDQSTPLVNPLVTERELIREERKSEMIKSRLVIEDQTGRGRLESNDDNISLIEARVGSTMVR